MEFSISGAVEFTEKNTLPGSQNQPGIINPDHLRGTEHRGFDMGRGITFKMPVIIGLRHKGIQYVQNVAFNGRVGIFIDRYGGRGMRYEKHADSRRHVHGFDKSTHLGRHVNHFGSDTGVNR